MTSSWFSCHLARALYLSDCRRSRSYLMFSSVCFPSLWDPSPLFRSFDDCLFCPYLHRINLHRVVSSPSCLHVYRCPCHRFAPASFHLEGSVKIHVANISRYKTHLAIMPEVLRRHHRTSTGPALKFRVLYWFTTSSFHVVDRQHRAST